MPSFEKRHDLYDHTIRLEGATVHVYERRPGGNLYVRYLEITAQRPKGRWITKSLGHTDKRRAKKFASSVAAKLVEGQKPFGVDGTEELNVGSLLRMYSDEVSANKRGQQPLEDARRRTMWEHVLGAATPALDVDEAVLQRFMRAREAGELAVPGLKLRADPSPSTIGADIVYLQSVYNWGHRKKVRIPGEKRRRRLLSENPIEDFERPSTPEGEKRRKWATIDWYVQARPHCAAVDRQGRLGPFLDLLEMLGWRLTAITRLHARSDLRHLQGIEGAPFGEIRHLNKGGGYSWVPMTRDVRAAIDELLGLELALGDLPLFPAPRSKVRPTWDRHYVAHLLDRLATRADLPPVNAHAFRRKWEEERRGLPEHDRMQAHGRRDRKTMEDSYLRRDRERMRQVYEHPDKLRAAGDQLVLDQTG
jgi:integrase